MAKKPALTEVTKIGSIEVDGLGRLNVRTDSVIMRGDVEASPVQHHRGVLEPGDDLTEADPKVVAIAGAVWTPEVIQARRDRDAAAAAAMPAEQASGQ
jgi:hypothetical protein